MKSNPTHRAIGPTDLALSGHTARPEVRIRPDHAAQHGRSTPRDAMTRRAAAKPPGAASMDYQQGFFSGPSS